MLDRRSIRATGLGMMASALVLYSAVYFFNSAPDSEAADTNENEVILSSEEYNTLQQELVEWEERVHSLEREAAELSEPEEEGEGEQITRMILTIESGMTSPEISEQLFSYGLIDNEDSFNEYLADQSLTDNIQIGQYDLNSTMTVEQIAKLITN
ncbi:hypothetical protein KP77_23160 [Jeotgalibacillus alimentarius]|uniref:Aminodeoxychorismate lyase n=1 Tax=Jeotgalibacillus alimentarius TaxID=135826 RepID=A0A0C2S3K2_9BACL|nr:endolytic transglycosylase MltG [Jeotgalibacillus alimentarius]KIL48529.1 hypothetical protein KP77_23160 [Jeotgalibacillus alimentarius]